MKKILFFLFAAVLAAGGVEAQEAVDSMKIFYRRGYRNVDLSFRDNRAQMERFLNLTEAALKNDRVEKVVIRSYASPDGTAEANERLSVGRAEELKAYLVREGNIPASLIEYHAEGIAWGMLREQVAASDMAGRDEVLDILDHTPLWIYDDDNRIVDGRKKQLMDLQGGITTCIGVTVVQRAATEDLKLPYLYDSSTKTVADGEGVWLAVGSASSNPSVGSHYSVIYKDANEHKSFVDCQGLIADTTCEQHGCRAKVIQ